MTHLTLMWFAMMAAMMAPTAWPWVRAYARFGGGSPIVFASGYLAAWFGYSFAAAGLQSVTRAPTAIAPLILVLAGAYQFSPAKRACLTHCRNPFSYFLARWKNGPANGFRMGVEHGLYCLGCCWALMATMIAVGLTNMWWMALLAGVTFVEQVVPRGQKLRVPLGVGLLGAGIWPLV